MNSTEHSYQFSAVKTKWLRLLLHFYTFFFPHLLVVIEVKKINCPSKDLILLARPPAMEKPLIKF